MLSQSIDTCVMRLRKKALKKMAGRPDRRPTSVMHKALEILPAKSGALMAPPLPIAMNARIMPYTVPTSPNIGPRVAITAV